MLVFVGRIRRTSLRDRNGSSMCGAEAHRQTEYGILCA